MSLEFGSSDLYERASRQLEELKPAFEKLDEIQNGLFKKNGENLEFIRTGQSLSSQIEMSCQREFTSSKFQKTKLYKALEQLSKRCREARSMEELKAVKAEYEALIKPVKENRYAAALNQTGINARAGLIKEGIVSDAKNAVDAKITLPIVQNVTKTDVLHQRKIAAEAIKRTQAEQAASEIAARAQKFYTSLSDVTTGKSAQESAEVIEIALKAAEEHQKQIVNEALERTKAETAAKKTAEQAQKYYNGLSNSVTGKSARKSAAVIEESLRAAEAQRKKIASQPLKTSKEDILTSTADKFSNSVKSMQDAEINPHKVKNPERAINKFKTFMKDKVVPYTKTKQFRYIVSSAAVITAIAAFIGISKHNKNAAAKTDISAARIKNC